eukprot:Rhum_TRINITY_DN22788_c0_g1::Rhum_TRINITY_DN22788_c0_g1_i1::g.176011::m.176011/K17292/TBCA; tubulin-specific chaperone A
MSTDAQTAKQFKVKFAALKRIQKDLAYARKEIGQEEARLEKIMNAEEKDDYRIRQQKQVLQESKVMVPDAIRRYKRAGEDLEMFLEREALEEDLAEEVEQAKALIEKIEEECKAE